MNFQTITQKYPASTKARRLGWKPKAKNLSNVTMDCRRLAKLKDTNIPMEIIPDQKKASRTSEIGTTAI